jgi:hypothetical protein
MLFGLSAGLKSLSHCQMAIAMLMQFVWEDTSIIVLPRYAIGCT